MMRKDEIYQIERSRAKIKKPIINLFLLLCFFYFKALEPLDPLHRNAQVGNKGGQAGKGGSQRG